MIKRVVIPEKEVKYICELTEKQMKELSSQPK
jgi:hypothetical protein